MSLVAARKMQQVRACLTKYQFENLCNFGGRQHDVNVQTGILSHMHCHTYFVIPILKHLQLGGATNYYIHVAHPQHNVLELP